MHEEVDKLLNGKSAFKYSASGDESHVRLLRLQYGEDKTLGYTLETMPIADLSQTEYRALSYTWGRACAASDVRQVQIDGQPFFVRRNLFDFLAAAAAKRLNGLIFIDAICIDQLDYADRQCQVQHMASIYRNANEVIAWLGNPSVDKA